MKFSGQAAVLALCAPALAAPQFSWPSFGNTGSTSSLASLFDPSDLSATTAAAAAVPTTAETTSTSSSSSSTENDVTDNTGCKEVTVIFARGTSEAGNVGTVAGPPFFSSLETSLGAGNVAVQGVDYPASAEGNANQGADGGPTMQKLVTTALSQCPNSKIVLSGYSQGAMVVHYAAKSLTAAQIGAVVLFGDPENNSAVGSVPTADVKEFCADGDDVCNGSGTFAITSAHLTYGNDADAAAAFVKSTLGL